MTKKKKKKSDKNLKNRFANAFKFFNHDINNLFCYCQKVFIHINIYMIRNKLNGTSLLEKEHFYCHLIMEDITDSDYRNAKKYCRDFEIRVSFICMFQAIHYC